MPGNRIDVASPSQADSNPDPVLHRDNFLVAKILTFDVRCSPQKHLPQHLFLVVVF
jgi:hypothetical protein